MYIGIKQRAHLRAALILLTGLIGPIGLLAAQSTADFFVGEIHLQGDNPLSATQTRRILSRYQGRQLSISGLNEAAHELSNELARQGYNFYRAHVPPQTLQNDSVTIEIQQIHIAQVQVRGNQHFSAENVKRSLPPVAPGSSPNANKIANALGLADDNPAKDVRVVFVKGEAPQTVDAALVVTDKNPNEFAAWINNAGSRLTSNSRLGFQYQQRNLWGRDHQLALSYTLSPEDVSELQQYGANYRIPIYRWRGLFNAFYSRSDADTGVVADVFTVAGAGETIGLGYTQYLNKGNHYQHRLKLGVIDKTFDSDVFFAQTNIGNDVRSRPVVFEYLHRFAKGKWTTNTNIAWSSNLSGGRFNDQSSYNAVRAGADRGWNKQNLSLQLAYLWNPKWTAEVNLFAQNSSDALIPGEQFGLGGAFGDFGPRGFFEREVTVDSGVKSSVQVNRHFPDRQMRLGLFFDLAYGDRNNPQAGESPDETLSSIGASFVWSIRPDLRLNLDFGYVTDGIDQTFTNTATDDGDSRLHVSLQYFPRWPWGKK